MISLLPFREELASAGRGPEAFVGRQPAARPRIGRLPPFFQARRPTWPWDNVVSGDPALSWPVGAQWGSSGGRRLPPTLPLGRLVVAPALSSSSSAR